ncbi:MAG: hypothetical protein AB7K09_05045 [Planctomycetota bacterium]
MARLRARVRVSKAGTGTTASGQAGKLSRGPDRLRRSGAGTHGGSVRQKNRRDRQDVRRRLRGKNDD